MKKLVLFGLMIGALTGCMKESENQFTCNYNECAVVAPAAQIEQVKEYLSTNSITATQHCSGLFYVIENPGSGPAPTVCNAVRVNYEGRLTNGQVFDASTSPATFRLADVITGFRNGVPLVKTGGKIRLFIPPALGYGNNPPPGSNIPPNSILIFDVELLGVQ